MPIKVAIVEDNQQYRNTLVRIIERESAYKCVGAFPTAEDALRTLPQLKPDVVLMDINLPGMNGVECVRELKRILPDTQIVMLTVYEDTDNIFNALAAGATGYLLKRSTKKEILESIQEVYNGGSPMTAHIARKVVQSFQRPTQQAPEVDDLSPREREVLEYLANGYIYKEIADKLGISYETVKTYIRRIYEKLHVRTRTEAVARFLKRE